MGLLMKLRFNNMPRPANLFGFFVFAAMAVAFVLAFPYFSANVGAQDDAKRLVSVYDRGEIISFLTDQKTIGAALRENGIELDPRDTVEPSRDEELVAPNYKVNIYRARPVIVVDGVVRSKIMTPYQTTAQIADDAGITMYPEDTAKLQPSTDFVGDGAGLQMTIDRSVLITLDLYSKKTQVRTQADTIGEMLKEKDIVLGKDGRTSLPVTTPITAGMGVRVWQEGKTTVTIDQPELFTTEKIYDADREIGYKVVKTPGINGTRSITYEIEVKDGIEISRKEIASIVAKASTKQIEVVGIKSLPGALTKAKGAQIFVDSKGVSHRETYYDLNMSVVMRACGQGGNYSVRFDGAKVDADGYVIIAANYGVYPRCSVVETSMGPGKVYDTGGFAVKHPYGFDLATDWSKADGI